MYLASRSKSLVSAAIQKALKMKTLSDNRNAQQSVIPFVLTAPTARRVSLAGDFNNWDPCNMQMYKGSNGVWYLSVLLTPGSHEYRFIVDGVWRDDPAAQQKTTNGFGNENCAKMVEAEGISESTRGLSHASSTRVAL